MEHLFRNCARVAVLAYLCLLTAKTATGQVQQATVTGSIAGRLFDRQTNAPVANAQIVLEVAGNSNPQRTTTDSTGEYHFSNVAFGEYVFAISRLGYSPLELDIVVDRAEPLSISIGLSPVPVNLPTVTVETSRAELNRKIAAGAPSTVSRRNMITSDEIEQRTLTHQTAYAIIRRLRPGWMTTRGDVGTASTRGNNRTILYVDGVRRGEVEDAQSIEGNTVARIFLFDAIEATQRWGTGHVAGAINVVLKPPTN